MKMRMLRRRYKVLHFKGPGAWQRLPTTPKQLVLQVFTDVGHDEHNCWDEYLIARFK